MSDVVIDNLPQEIIADAKRALKDATVAGKLVFSKVHDVDDVRTFVRSADVFESPESADVAIVNAQPTQEIGEVDTEKVNRIESSIVIRFVAERAAGSDEAAIREQARKLVAVVRAALMVDPSRGGRCNLARSRGQVIDGTDVAGRANLYPAIENTTFRTIVVPASFVWSTF